MNPWRNVVCIVVVLCIQDYIGVDTVAGTELNEEESRNVFETIRELYVKLKEKVAAQRDRGETWKRWIENSDKIAEKGDLDIYVEWAKSGAVMLANANFSNQGAEVQDLIERTKSKIREIIPENSKPGAAASINKVLDTLKTALEIRSSMEVAESEGTKLNPKDGGNVFAIIRDLYQELGSKIVPFRYKIVGLHAMIFNKVIQLERTIDLDTYVKWVKNGAIILANANYSDQGNEIQDLIETTKSEIIAEIPESNVPGAAASINKILDTLKIALEKCINMEDAETEGRKLNRKERTLVYGYVSLLYYEVKNELKTENEGLTSWAQDILKFQKEGDLNKYVKWLQSGATMIINANTSKSNTKVEDPIEVAKSKIGEIILENKIPGAVAPVDANSNNEAVASINRILDTLKNDLQKREDAESEEDEYEGKQEQLNINSGNDKLEARIAQVMKHIEENISEDAAKAINSVLDNLMQNLPSLVNV